MSKRAHPTGSKKRSKKRARTDNARGLENSEKQGASEKSPELPARPSTESSAQKGQEISKMIKEVKTISSITRVFPEYTLKLPTRDKWEDKSLTMGYLRETAANRLLGRTLRCYNEKGIMSFPRLFELPNRNLTLEEIRFVAFHLIHDLHTVHTAGLLHRDIKPENVMLKSDCTPCLIDFGLAIPEAIDYEFKVHKFPIQPPEWTSKKRARVSFEWDIWHLGNTLYHFMTGDDVGKADKCFISLLGISVLKAINSASDSGGQLTVGNNSAKKQCFDLLISMLNPDPSQRPSTEKLLAHSFFNAYPKPRKYALGATGGWFNLDEYSSHCYTVLIKWLVEEVCVEYKYNVATCLNAIGLLKAFIDVAIEHSKSTGNCLISQRTFQGIGITCLHLSIKLLDPGNYQGIKLMSDFCANCYSEEELLQMELLIVDKLQNQLYSYAAIKRTKDNLGQPVTDEIAKEIIARELQNAPLVQPERQATQTPPKTGSPEVTSGTPGN